MSASLSVIIPAYNEAARLGKTLRAVVDYLRQNAPDAEVIVVDDGSSDETAELARKVFRTPAASALQSSVTNQTSEKDARYGSDCSPRVATSRCFPMPTSRHRSAKHQNWSIRS